MLPLRRNGLFITLRITGCPLARRLSRQEGARHALTGGRKGIQVEELDFYTPPGVLARSQQFRHLVFIVLWNGLDNARGFLLVQNPRLSNGLERPASSFSQHFRYGRPYLHLGYHVV